MNKADIDIIIIRGAPGSGKSQTAKCLTEFFPQGVKMEIDKLRSMVISVDWTNQIEHINILEISTKLICDFLKIGFKPVIVVDTFSGDKILRYLSDLRKINSELNIAEFGLYTSTKELAKRISKRKKGEFKDVGICLKINEDLLKIKSETEIQIDTTNRKPQGTAQIIINQMNNTNLF
jgi:broad-specificity NMP kinase